MKQILDHEEDEDVKNIPTSHTRLRSMIYLFIMIVGGVLYMKYISHFPTNLYGLIYGSFILVFAYLALSSFFFTLRFFFSKNKKSRVNPYWFDILESAFIWWVVSMFFIAIGKYV